MLPQNFSYYSCFLSIEIPAQGSSFEISGAQVVEWSSALDRNCLTGSRGPQFESLDIQLFFSLHSFWNGIWIQMRVDTCNRTLNLEWKSQWACLQDKDEALMRLNWNTIDLPWVVSIGLFLSHFCLFCTMEYNEGIFAQREIVKL